VQPFVHTQDVVVDVIEWLAQFLRAANLIPKQILDDALQAVFRFSSIDLIYLLVSTFEPFASTVFQRGRADSLVGSRRIV
jgi:hypothetical protein